MAISKMTEIIRRDLESIHNTKESLIIQKETTDDYASALWLGENTSEDNVVVRFIPGVHDDDSEIWLNRDQARELHKWLGRYLKKVVQKAIPKK